MMVALRTCLRIECGSDLILSRRFRSSSLRTILVLLLFAIAVLLPLKTARLSPRRLSHTPARTGIPKNDHTTRRCGRDLDTCFRHCRSNHHRRHSLGACCGPRWTGGATTRSIMSTRHQPVNQRYSVIHPVILLTLPSNRIVILGSVRA